MEYVDAEIKPQQVMFVCEVEPSNANSTDDEAMQQLFKTPVTQTQSTRKSVAKTSAYDEEDIEYDQDGEPIQQLFKTPATQTRSTRKSVAKTPAYFSKLQLRKHDQPESLLQRHQHTLRKTLKMTKMVNQ